MMNLVTKRAAEFNKQLVWLAKQVEGNFGKVIRKGVVDLYADIAIRTPVDTGRARAGWMIGASNDWKEPPDAFDDSSKPKKQRAMEVIRGNVKGFKFDWDIHDIILIYNNVKHIEILENGHSDQAPYGMVAVSLKVFNRHFRKEARKLGFR